MPVLFVTSFTREMYAVTGERLLSSFVDWKTKGTMLVCHEGFDQRTRWKHRGILTYRLEQSELLRTWLERNRDLIPTSLGGEAGNCDCSKPELPFSWHRPRCHGFWFNRNAARYFRKIVSLEYAMQVQGYRYIVWLDSDCVIRGNLTERTVRAWFGGNDVFYHRSPQRRVIESGVLGIRNSAGGRLFVETTIERYRSGRFRRNMRWDDGYQFQLALRSLPNVARVDLATGATGKRPYGHVLPHSPAGEYIAHYKGTHARTLKL